MIKLTAQFVAQYLASTKVATTDLPDLIRSSYQALTEAGREPDVAERAAPAVPIRKSISGDRITCLECGTTMKMLRRHLANDHGLTPDEYRAKWDLPADYPVVAPAYAARRSELARQYGLGTKRKDAAAVKPAAKPAATPQASTKTLQPAEESPRGHRYPTNRWAKPASG